MKRRKKGQKRQKVSDKEMASYLEMGAENMAGRRGVKDKSKKGSGLAKPC